VASQPIDERGQSPGAPGTLGAPTICKYFFCWHIAHNILTSAKLGFYFIAAFDPTTTFSGACIMTIRWYYFCMYINQT